MHACTQAGRQAGSVRCTTERPCHRSSPEQQTTAACRLHVPGINNNRRSPGHLTLEEQKWQRQWGQQHSVHVHTIVRHDHLTAYTHTASQPASKQAGTRCPTESPCSARTKQAAAAATRAPALVSAWRADKLRMQQRSSNSMRACMHKEGAQPNERVLTAMNVCAMLRRRMPSTASTRSGGAPAAQHPRARATCQQHQARSSHVRSRSLARCPSLSLALSMSHAIARVPACTAWHCASRRKPAGCRSRQGFTRSAGVQAAASKHTGPLQT
jgi:hypothetical protein